MDETLNSEQWQHVFYDKFVTRSSLSSNQLTFLIFTARKQSLRRLCFTPVCQLFCSEGGVVSQHGLAGIQRGWYLSMPCRSPGPHPGGKLRGLSRPIPGWGLSRPTPCGRYASYWNAFLLSVKFNRNIDTAYVIRKH